MESEQSQNFDDRLSQWVANQGFWFQIRYSMSGSGSTGNVMFHLLRMGFRVCVFLLVAAVATGVYLVWRTGTADYREGFEASVKASLKASEIELQGLSRGQGELSINGLACKGGDGSFFSALEARNIRCKMGFLDGLTGRWNPGAVTISRLDIDLRAGADDEEAARLMGDALFMQSGGLELKTVEITDATLRWGYGRSIAPGASSLADPGGLPVIGYQSDHTRGSIRNSFLRIQRTDGEMRLSFKGGSFSQNWLQKLEIVEFEVVCNRDGMIFEKAEFRRLQGSVDFTGLKVKGGERPEIDGTVKVRSLALDVILPPAARSFVEGTLSGEFRVSGSTNSSEGIIFDGAVTLDSHDVISLRERLHLLSALSVVDFSRNYHRIDFREGFFNLKTGGGGMEMTNVRLVSDEEITLDGKLTTRLPTVEETRTAGVGGPGGGDAPLFDLDEHQTDELEAQKEADFTLTRAARALKEEKDGSGSTLFDRLEEDLSVRRFQSRSAEFLSQELRYEGEFTITLPQDAFERAPRLAARYPVDPEMKRVPVKVPVEGGLFDITWDQAKDIYQEGRR